MTRIEIKFKIPYGAISEAHFQTDTRLSLKIKNKIKKKKKETQYLIKRSNHLFTKQKKQKKKSKTLKPKTYFPIKIYTRSNYRFFSVPSNTQIGLALQQKP